MPCRRRQSKCGTVVYHAILIFKFRKDGQEKLAENKANFTRRSNAPDLQAQTDVSLFPCPEYLFVSYSFVEIARIGGPPLTRICGLYNHIALELPVGCLVQTDQEPERNGASIEDQCQQVAEDAMDDED
jgi:hypothetical protein